VLKDNAGNPYSLVNPPVFKASRDYEISIDSSTLANFTFVIHATALGGAVNNSPELTVRVICGSETVTMTSDNDLLVYSKNSVNYETIFTKWYSLFQSDKSRCPISHYELYSDSALTTLVSSTQIYLINNLDTEGSKLATNYLPASRGFYYLKGKTNGNIFGTLKLDIVVCGLETLNLVSTERYDTTLLNNATTTTTAPKFGLEHSFMMNFFAFDAGTQSHPKCAESVFKLCQNADCSLPLTDFTKFEILVNATTGESFMWIKNQGGF